MIKSYTEYISERRGGTVRLRLGILPLLKKAWVGMNTVISMIALRAASYEIDDYLNECYTAYIEERDKNIQLTEPKVNVKEKPEITERPEQAQASEQEPENVSEPDTDNNISDTERDDIDDFYPIINRETVKRMSRRKLLREIENHKDLIKPLNSMKLRYQNASEREYKNYVSYKEAGNEKMEKKYKTMLDITNKNLNKVSFEVETLKKELQIMTDQLLSVHESKVVVNDEWTTEDTKKVTATVNQHIIKKHLLTAELVIAKAKTSKPQVLKLKWDIMLTDIKAKWNNIFDTETLISKNIKKEKGTEKSIESGLKISKLIGKGTPSYILPDLEGAEKDKHKHFIITDGKAAFLTKRLSKDPLIFAIISVVGIKDGKMYSTKDLDLGKSVETTFAGKNITFYGDEDTVFPIMVIEESAIMSTDDIENIKFTDVSEVTACPISKKHDIVDTALSGKARLTEEVKNNLL